MSQDWLADVRRFDAGADENVVAGIVRYCGIALRSENASKVTFTESEETDRVRDNFLKKKLGRTDDDASLDAAIQSVGASMGGGTQNRVSLYYLLTKHFGLLSMFGGATAAAAAAPVAAAAAAPTPIAAAMSAPAASNDHAPTRPSGGGARTARDDDDGGDFWGIALLAGAVMAGAIVLAMLISIWVQNKVLPANEAEAGAAAAPAAPAPATEPTEAAPAVPDGAGVTATERDGKPMLSVYFDSGSSDVAPDFGTVAADVLAYLKANPDAKVAISGYNDPTGNAAANAELSKTRAQKVQAALVAAGVAEDRTDLVKPDDATTTDMTPAEARRVEIVIVE
jgi:outer membrane protein OmpA-like peptidoglycan-associated protein